jgi:hypothetical protein
MLPLVVTRPGAATVKSHGWCPCVVPAAEHVASRV